MPPPEVTTAVPAAGHLALAGLVAELGHGLVEEAVAVGAALGELAAVRVHRQLAVEGDAPAAVEPVLASPKPQKPRPSSHEMALNVKPSYTQGEVDVGGRRLVRVQRWADWPSTWGSWVIGALVPRDPLE